MIKVRTFASSDLRYKDFVTNMYNICNFNKNCRMLLIPYFLCRFQYILFNNNFFTCTVINCYNVDTAF